MDNRMEDGVAAPLGATVRENGVNFAVFSRHAEAIEVCLFDASGGAEIGRHRLPARTGDIHHGLLPGLAAGALYGLRAHGPFQPEIGHRFNPNKLLVDPYATDLVGSFQNSMQIYGYPLEHRNDLVFDTSDSAAFVPKSRVGTLAPVADTRPRHGWSDTIIYEAHVKGLTARHPDVPAELRGTYEALAHPSVIGHLTGIGVTAIELMPIHAFVDDRFLIEKNLSNYWGYNTINFFTPECRYFGPNGRDGLRQAIQALHAAGIEVFLDVVYNHTAESDHLGPTLSFRGLDNATYYRLVTPDHRYHINDSGTGNVMNMAEPIVTRLIMDSLRHWVAAYNIDGFRFDLMTTLAREADRFAPDGRFFTALTQDPVLAETKLIAEPWDVGPGGYRLGEFPPGIAEWNDRFRDGVRRFWRGDPGSARDMAAALLGSAEKFDRNHRPAWSSVNFAAAHDGFTLSDTTAYAEKHNEANGEGNRDGHPENFSDNLGIEGETDDSATAERRRRRVQNLLATVFLAQGTPMIFAGDELGNSQNGNNNAYAQDNETTWIDWGNADTERIAIVAALSSLRRDCPALRQSRFLHGNGTPPDVEWHAFDGGPPNWAAPDLAAFLLVLRKTGQCPTDKTGDETLLIAVNGGPSPVTFAVPSGFCHLECLFRTDNSREQTTLAGESLAVYKDCAA